jgi:alpha-L-fucosidase
MRTRVRIPGGRDPRRRSLRGRLAALLVTVLVAAGLGFLSPQAHADLQNPRQDFLRASTSGLFLHWGERTSPGYTSCSAWENAVTGGGWSADYWVNEAQKLHASYLVLATFHSRLGYARPWPSKVPGSCATKRDFLGELITAAHAKNMEVILYMTNDPQWHDEGGHEWLDSSAYSAYKGKSIDLTTNAGFGQFSYDNFFDVMSSHPSLDGFWIDNDNDYWLDHNLYQQIYQLHPNMTISNNNEDTPIMDMISNEQKTGMTPAYDMPQAYYTAQPRLTEADYKLPSSGAWWYDGSNSSVDYGLNIGRYAANAGSSVKSLMAETAMVNGKFPSNQANFNNFMNTYLPPIWESVHGVEGGGYMYGGMPGGNFGNGAYGYTTISKTDPNQQYVHVVTKPTSGSSVKLRDAGYDVAKVTNLRTGASVDFSQANGYLTISGISGWDQYDTVFKVQMSGRSGITTGVSATANASASGHGAGNLVDGSYLNYWQSNGSLPATLTLDQGSSKHVAYLAVNQREDSVTQTSSSSKRIHAYTVQTSNDGSSWSTVKTGNLPNARGAQYIDVGATARYVRLVANSLYSSSGTFAIDEMWLGNAYASSGGTTPPPGGRYEAEDGNCQGTIDSNHAGFSGTGFCNTTNAVGSTMTWTVDRDSAGSATLSLRYSNGTTAGRPATVTVDGGTPVTVDFPSTGTWDTWATATLPATLTAGANTITVTSTTADGTANLDYLDVG